jgi:hypothetical protein
MPFGSPALLVIQVNRRNIATSEARMVSSKLLANHLPAVRWAMSWHSPKVILMAKSLLRGIASLQTSVLSGH